MSKETLKINLYAVYDQVAGSYGEPFLAINDGVATRRFNYVMSQSDVIANDCKLFKVGQFDSDLGKLYPIDNPEFICNFERVGDVTNE